MTEVVLRFSPELEYKVLHLLKVCTSRRSPHGRPGDCFRVDGMLFELLRVERRSLLSVASLLYNDEGFESPEEFRSCWRSLYGDFEPGLDVFVHYFRPVKKCLSA